MASVRRKYQSHLAAKDEPPVTTMPQHTSAKLPEPAVDAKPPEPITKESPADVAARSALRDRLREMEQAETIVREVTTAQQQEPQQPQQLTLEQQIAHLPERIQQWCKADPRLATDPERIAQAQYCHHVARREVGEEFTDKYYDRMEQMLGLREQPRPQPNSNGQAQHKPIENKPPAPAPRASAPPPRQSVPMSAPPTRDVPSMTTGRAHSHRAPLTADELQIAASSGQTPEEYQQQKERLQRLKQAGAIQ